MENLISVLLQLVTFVVLLLLGWIVGSLREKRHLEELEKAEAAYRDLPLLTVRRMPAAYGSPTQSGLVTGSVVISVDYFKRLLAGLRGLVGGQIKAYQSLLHRARREALLRLQIAARAQGYDAVINVRLENSRLASSRSDGKGTSGIEVLAYGTGIRRP